MLSPKTKSWNSFRKSKSTTVTVDPASTKLIFEFTDILLPVFRKIVNLSLTSGTVLPPSGMSSPRASMKRTPFSLSDLCWKPISLPRDDSQCNCVHAFALVRVLSEADVAIITPCVCVCVCVCASVCVRFIFLLSLFVTLHIFLHLTAMCSSAFGNGWVGRSCLYFLVQVSFGSFSVCVCVCVCLCVCVCVTKVRLKQTRPVWWMNECTVCI